MKLLFVGDIVGEPGRTMLKDLLPGIIADNNINFTVANGENAAGGRGLTRNTADEIFSYGVNVLTMGNHTFDRKEVDLLTPDKRILRPANYPPGVPGKGWGVYDIPGEECGKIAVINLMGRVFIPALIDCPFRTAEKILDSISQETKNIFVDFHAEITSEKQAMGWFLNGKVSAVMGTHTHVQTADERVLPDGTAYITDTGMTGPGDGVIGMDREIILKKYLTSLPYRFSVAKGPVIFNGCIVEIDEKTGKASGIERIKK
ncbi:MAG: TIGR00282 family metallophosphoesterase [Elusimicrobiota bacterium]